MMKIVRRSALLLVSLVVAGCGGKASTLPPSMAPTTSPNARPVDVAFTILIPKASAVAGRRAQYVSVATKAVTVNFQPFNTTASSPGCSTVSTGLSCTFALKVPPGSAVPFTVTAYDQPLDANGQVQGNQLSTGTTTADIVEGKANTVTVTLLGTPGHVSITLADSSPPMGSPASLAMTLDVRDADGYPIVGPWSSEIILSFAQLVNNLSFEVNGQNEGVIGGVTSSSDVVKLVYAGVGVRAATIEAYNQFAPAGVYIGSATFSPQPAFGSETVVGTSLINASAYQDSSYQQTVWFTEPAKAKIAKYLPGGSIQELSVPSGGSPLRLYGDAMNIAFTESNNSYGDIAPMLGTSIIEHTLAHANAGPYDIRPSPFGPTTYVTEKTAGGIAIINVGDPIAGGTTTDVTYTTGAANSSPAGLAFGGDGMWYADPGANEIGFITSAGAITHHPVPTAGAAPTEMTDSDGNGRWWFTEPGASKIASFDQNANITEYPSPGVPKAIVATQNDVLVLTTTGVIEDFSESSGALLGTYTPPASSNGPAVWIDAGAPYGTLLVLRSDGTHGSIQVFTYD